jgi:hypothetical protein
MRPSPIFLRLANKPASRRRISATALMTMLAFALACLFGGAQGVAQKAYIPVTGANNVSVIDTTTNATVATIDIPPSGVQIGCYPNPSSPPQYVSAPTRTPVALVALRGWL